MRYMLLVYSREQRDGLTAEEHEQIRSGHRNVMQEAARKGVLRGAEPLATTDSATTVRVDEGKILVTDGPFAETKEQLAGYYIMECANLDEAIEWAARIPSGCRGDSGCIEVRPLPGLPVRREEELTAGAARNV